MSAALAEVAAELGDGATLAAVAMAWALHKTPYVFPVIGGRRPEQLLELIKVRPSPRRISPVPSVSRLRARGC